MAGQETPAVVELRIPCRPEYVGVARLTILGVASRMHFTYDEVEDVRLAVGEACTTAVERAVNANQTDTDIRIRSEISDSTLRIEIEDTVPRMQQQTESKESSEELDEQNLGALLMELLVDEFRVEQTGKGGTLVTMTKRAG